jgi:RHS repeat-associated protein
MTSYTTGGNNEMTASPGMTYTHDNEGKLTSQTDTNAHMTTSFSYDFRDQMSVVSSGSVIDHVMYGSFDTVTSESNSTNGDRFKFTGREYDAKAQLQFNRARVFAARVGQWSEQDPVGFPAGDTNLYRYADNAPTDAIDPNEGVAFVVEM